MIEDSYFSFVESSFNYLVKYAVVLAIISEKRKYIDRLVGSLKMNSYEDEFVSLLLSVFENFDIEKSFDLIEKCSNVSYF